MAPIARRKRDDDKKRKRKRKPPPKQPTPQPPPTTATEDLKAKSTQSSEDAMNATPGSMAEASGVTDAAVYSTGPGAVVAYDYQRTGTYAEDYATQQAVDVQGQGLPGPGQVSG